MCSIDGQPSLTHNHSSSLFHGSPDKVTGERVFQISREEGVPVKKVISCSNQQVPSPNSEYISYSKKNMDVLQSLGEAGSISELFDHLNGQEKLTGPENVIRMVCSKLVDLSAEFVDLSAEFVDLSAKNVDLSAEFVDLSAKNVDLSARLDELTLLNTSYLILVYDCLKHLNDELKNIYHKEIVGCDKEVLIKFGFVIKTFQKKAGDKMITKTTGDNSKVCKKVDFITFAAALHDFIFRRKLYQEVSTENGGQGPPFSEESSRKVVEQMKVVFKGSVKKFVSGLSGGSSLLRDAACKTSSIGEWHKLFKLRSKRDHLGGHCATWRDTADPEEESKRLNKVVEIFSRLMHEEHELLEDFPVLKHCAFMYMQEYVLQQKLKARDKPPISKEEEDYISWAMRD